MSLRSPIINDLGNSEVKAGYRTDNSIRRLRFPSYIGIPKYNKILRTLHNFQYKEQFVGDDYNPYLGVLKLRHPFKNGMLYNEKDISFIFNHIFSKLKLSPEKVSHTPLLIGEALLTPKKIEK